MFGFPLRVPEPPDASGGRPTRRRLVNGAKGVVAAGLLLIPLTCLTPAVNAPRELYLELIEVPLLSKGVVAGTELALILRLVTPMSRNMATSADGIAVSTYASAGDHGEVAKVATIRSDEPPREAAASSGYANGETTSLPVTSSDSASPSVSGGKTGETLAMLSSRPASPAGVGVDDTLPASITPPNSAVPPGDSNLPVSLANAIASLSAAVPQIGSETGYDAPGVSAPPIDGGDAHGPGDGAPTPPGTDGPPIVGGGIGGDSPPGGGNPPPGGGGSTQPGADKPPVGGGGSTPPGAGSPPVSGGTPRDPGVGGSPHDPPVVVITPPGEGRSPPIVIPPDLDLPPVLVVVPTGPGSGGPWSPPATGGSPGESASPPADRIFLPAVTIIAVPEPQTLWLLIAAGLALVIVSHGRVRRS